MGYDLPPMVIFYCKTTKTELTVGEAPGIFYAPSNNSWIDSELFPQWFTYHFLKYAPSAHPLLLLLDSHSSHYQPDVVRIAAKFQVIIFRLPPHTAHVTQPLDHLVPSKHIGRQLAGNTQSRIHTNQSHYMNFAKSSARPTQKP